MYSGHRRQSPGFTLVEILVVLGVIAVISAIAIPGLIRLGAFSRDEFKRAVSEVDAKLRAAQIYSNTFHVNAAVVYNLDHYSAVEAAGGTGPGFSPIVDSLTGQAVRQIEAAAIMYQLPSTSPHRGTYVPVPGDQGEFAPLPFGMTVMLQHPERDNGTGGYVKYYTDFDNHNYQRPDIDDRNGIGGFGMNSIVATLGPPESRFPVAFPAHVFRPNGRMAIPVQGFIPDPECGPCDFGSQDCELCVGERFTVYIAPGANRPLDDRVVQPETAALFLADGTSNLRYRRIFLHRSTARISVPGDF